MKKLVLYFVLAYLISWITWLPLILPKFGIDTLPVLPKYHHYLGSFGPLIAAFIVKYIYDGWKDVKDLLTRIVQWKVKWIWYLVSEVYYFSQMKVSHSIKPISGWNLRAL